MFRLVCDKDLCSDAPVEYYDALESSFFQRKNADGSSPQLPTPATVLAQSNGKIKGQAVFHDIGVFVKHGRQHDISIEEAQTLQAIKSAFPNGEVPVPELFGWRSMDRVNYIYMSFIPCPTLKQAWDLIEESGRLHVASELKAILQRLRSLVQNPEDHFIGSVTRTQVQDITFRGEPIAGPFTTIKDFNDALQHRTCPWIPLGEKPPDPFRALLPDDAKICFTHADLHFENIMVSGDDLSKITAIIDWGCSSWLPEWYEFIKMALHNDEDHPNWTRSVLDAHEEAGQGFSWYWHSAPP